MSDKTVMCARLNKELPALDPTSTPGRMAMKMGLMLGGEELQQQLLENISEQAWNEWSEHMVMILNEYQLDPTSGDANKILRKHLDDFLFAGGGHVPGYVPPEEKSE